MAREPTWHTKRIEKSVIGTSEKVEKSSLLLFSFLSRYQALPAQRARNDTEFGLVLFSARSFAPHFILPAPFI